MKRHVHVSLNWTWNAQPFFRRLRGEFKEYQKGALDGSGIVLTTSDDLMSWTAYLPGPEGSIYEGGVFQLDISIPSNYPFSPPSVKFETRY